MIVLGLVVALILAGVALLSPFSGLLCYLAWFLIRPQEFLSGFGGTYPLERIIALGLIGGAIFHCKILQPRQLVSHSLNKALIAFFIVNLLSAFNSIWLSETLLVTIDFFKLVIFYFLIVNLVDNESRLRQFLWVYVLCMAWNAGSALYLFEKDPVIAQGIERAQALTVSFGDPNALASSLALVLPIGVALQRHTKGLFTRQLLRSLLLLVLICIIFTGSRAGMIQLIFIALYIAWRSTKRLSAVLTALGLLLVIWVLMPPTYQERFLTIFTFTDTSTAAGKSAYGRIIGWEVASQIFKDHPLLGVGAGNFPTAWGTLYTYKGRHGWFQPHNLPGQVLAELGILGALTFAAYVWTLLTTNHSTRLKTANSDPSLMVSLNNSIVIVICTLLVGGLFGHNLYRYNWYLVGALTVAVARLVQQELAARSKPSQEALELQPSLPAPHLRKPEFFQPSQPGAKL